MKYLSNEVIKDKNILLRCDFNVPVKDNKILDNSKILKSLDTIKFLLNNNNKVIILSHFGRVKNEEDKKNNSLKIVCDELKKYIDVVFIENNDNIDFYLNTSKSNCFLLENTRFTDVLIKRESVNDLNLSKYWAEKADVFVIDAFASMHRCHSSTAGISNYLPTYIGFLAEKEINKLTELKNSESLIVIMGGAKVDDKILSIESIIKKCKKIIITGGILNTFLKVMGYNVGKSLVSNDDTVLKSVKSIIDNYSDKIIYSKDMVVFNNDKVFNKEISNINDNDIIYDNIINIKDIINNNDTVFLNGSAGMYEIDEYSLGTKKLLDDLYKSGAKVYVGGGDAVSSINRFGYTDKFYYLSSGGGATLEFVAFDNLKSLEYIEENNKIV